MAKAKHSHLWKSHLGNLRRFDAMPSLWLLTAIRAQFGSQVSSFFSIMVFITMQVLGVTDGKTDIQIECLADRFMATGNQWKGYTLRDLSLPTLGSLDFTIAFPNQIYLEKCCQKIQLRFTDTSMKNIVGQSLNNEGGYFIPHVEWTLCTPSIRLFNCYAYNKEIPNTISSKAETKISSALTNPDGNNTINKPLHGSWWIVLQHCIKLGGKNASYEVGTFGQSGLSAASAPRYSGDVQIAAKDTIEAPKVKISSSPPCLIEGRVYTKEQWHGYLAKMAVPKGSSISYRFLFKEPQPSNAALLTVLFYTQDDIDKFSATDSCEKKVSVLDIKANSHKILSLSIGNIWAGCSVESINGIPTYTCQGGRNIGEEHTVYIAVANCKRQGGLKLYYAFEFQSYDNDCPGIRRRNSCPELRMTKLLFVVPAIVLSITCFTWSSHPLDS